MSIKILAFAGSARQESFNKKLIKVAAEVAQKAGAEVTLVDLKDFPMPLMDQDLEAKEGMPEFAKKFKDLMLSHDGFLISTPEYNSSIPPLLKNAFDWASRKNSPAETPLVAYKGKIGGLLSASPGAMGGLRSLLTVRAILEHLGVLVVPSQYALGKAGEAFGPEGNLKDATQQAAVEKVAQDLVQTIRKMKA